MLYSAMIKRTHTYAGYKIDISFDSAYEEYHYVVKDKDDDVLFEGGPFDDNNSAYSDACVRINEET